MNNDTLQKLREMRMPALAKAFEEQLSRPHEYQDISFNERFMLLIDAEYDSRHNNRISRLIKSATLSNSRAYLENIEYLPDRHLDRSLLEELKTNSYILQNLNLILIGATGSGKTYISNALGMNACLSGYKTRYLRSQELFLEFEAARLQGRYQEFIKKYRKYPLMILDEFLLVPTNETEQRDLLELMESRTGHSSTIVCSQFQMEGWHDRLGGGALADSILDRLIPSAYTMKIQGDVSMRKRTSGI